MMRSARMSFMFMAKTYLSTYEISTFEEVICSRKIQIQKNRFISCVCVRLILVSNKDFTQRGLLLCKMMTWQPEVADKYLHVVAIRK